MKRIVFCTSVVLLLAVTLLYSSVSAAELLDVKPVVIGSNVVIEVTADIPMTYTYYKVPGQARAVVDIADADPEKVEPLIVVNKGAVASISVDKAMIGDMTVSRLVFNLISETEIAVIPGADRKSLSVSFGGGKPIVVKPADASPTPAPVTVAASAPPTPEVPAIASPAVAPTVEEKQVAVVAPKSVAKEEEDPLGLDEPQPLAVPVKDVAPAQPAARVTKLEPVVPATVEEQAAPSMAVVKGIVIGAGFIDIQTNGTVEKFKPQRLSKPERLSIEIPGTSKMKIKEVQVSRFGVSKVRIGTTPGFVRVVLDTTKSLFPKFEIVSIENGLRVNFK
jgi:type IV pilus assembly protein PilQ